MSASVILGCFWYLYVLETLSYPMTYYLETLVMLPGVLFTFYNIISIWTGWSFTVSQDNIYAHGPLVNLSRLKTRASIAALGGRMNSDGYA